MILIRTIRLGAALLAAALAGCGIPAEQAPRPIPQVETPPASAAPESTGTGGPGTRTEVLYFVKDGKLVAVRRATASPPTLDVHLDHLLAGPTEAEGDTGLTSALTGLTITANAHLTGATAVVDLGNLPDESGRSDEILGYGQIVCTLTTRPEVVTVSFRHDGQPVGVPRADGSLAQHPLTASDYAALTTGSPR